MVYAEIIVLLNVTMERDEIINLAMQACNDGYQSVCLQSRAGILGQVDFVADAIAAIKKQSESKVKLGIPESGRITSTVPAALGCELTATCYELRLPICCFLRNIPPGAKL